MQVCIFYIGCDTLTWPLLNLLGTNSKASLELQILRHLQQDADPMWLQISSVFLAHLKRKKHYRGCGNWISLQSFFQSNCLQVLAQSFMKSGDETLEGLSEKQNSNEKVETSTRGIREQKIIVVLGKSVFLIPKWEEAEKGEEKKMHRCFSLHSLTPTATQNSQSTETFDHNQGVNKQDYS